MSDPICPVPLSTASHESVFAAITKLVAVLDADRGDATHWTGTLAASALSTATAISAMELVRRQAGKLQRNQERLAALIDGGLRWLAAKQNDDGGFGDTDRSPSNISTTALVLAAWKLTGHDSVQPQANARAERFFQDAGAWQGLRKRYGKDKTFVVPIMTNCALAGMVSWDQVPQLPFPAACLPQSWYRLMQLPVVSYAIPALVAIGQVRFHHRPPKFGPFRWPFQWAIQPSLKVLQRMQPASGGYLEATPLTSFVLMSLASINRENDPVGDAIADRAVQFLSDSVLPDGSWPIDTNLATWVTSLTIGALTRLDSGESESNETKSEVEASVPEAVIDWLLDCQYQHRHPFTGAEPFGWGWSDLSGAVPDGDDTPAALIALWQWRQRTKQDRVGDRSLSAAALQGIGWLLNLQNRDGGWPTFCRGWGTLPFDRSGTDLTAHALRALHLWRPEMPEKLQEKSDRATRRGWDYLRKTQRPDGSWLPLWFGNHNQKDDENPVYGTARVLIAAGHCGWKDKAAIGRAEEFLVRSQNSDGGWGGGPDVTDRLKRLGLSFEFKGQAIQSSVEETAVGLEGLLATGGLERHREAIISSLDWLLGAVREARIDQVWPIGFYFAKLWYHERLYPTIFSLSAMAEWQRTVQHTQVPRTLMGNLPEGNEFHDR